MNHRAQDNSTAKPAVLEFAELIRDKLVLVALAGNAVPADYLRDHGASDVLILERTGSLKATRNAGHVRQRYRRIPDVRKNNCNLAILYGRAAFALLEKREFARFTHVLVPLGPALLAAGLGLLVYGRRKVLMLAGITEFECNGKRRRYAVLETRVKPGDQSRQYGPAGLSPMELTRRLAGLNYVVLRASEMIEADRHHGDIDLLVSQDGLRGLKERFQGEIGTYPLDVYTDDGQEGHAYKGVPYFTLKLAKGILDSAIISEGGIRIAAPHWRFLSFCYHLLFHDKSRPAHPDTLELSENSFTKPQYYQELTRLAKCANQPCPRTFDALENLLRSAGVLPSLDMIGFYSNKNAFLKNRYFDAAPMKAGLATFFVRDFGSGLEQVNEVRARLLEHFEILVEGPVNAANHARVICGVRGGNWLDNAAPGGLAEPVYWFVCWDPSPRPPCTRTRRKHPRVDNENIRLKDHLRRDLGGSIGNKILRIIHSSDNSLEAVDHLETLGLLDDPEEVRRLYQKSITRIELARHLNLDKPICPQDITQPSRF